MLRPAIALFASSLLGITSAIAAINSNLSIPPRESFILGGGQANGFNVSGRNTGPVAIEIYAGEANTQRFIGRVEPGQSVVQKFRAQESAVLKNTSSTLRGEIKLRITGQTSGLGMRYNPNSN
jgi:hypothetical protein